MLKKKYKVIFKKELDKDLKDQAQHLLIQLRYFYEKKELAFNKKDTKTGNYFKGKYLSVKKQLKKLSVIIKEEY